GALNVQLRDDRDEYIKINETNMKELGPKYFNRSLFPKVDTYKTIYDYGSLLHCNAYPFSNNSDKLKTVEPKDNYYKSLYENMMGQTSYVTFYDYKYLNLLYCNDSCKYRPEIECFNSGYQNPKDCTKCVCPSGFIGWNCSENPISFDNKCGQIFYHVTKQEQKIEYFLLVYYCAYKLKASNNKRICLKIFKDTYTSADKYPCVPNNGIQIKFQKEKGATGLCICKRRKNDFYVKTENDEAVIIIQVPHTPAKIHFSFKELEKTCGDLTD
uniref:Metalloendopeptidase n=1 Tax=Parastrongyloides trichosuri TaxID=131310 RepID=A0A0N4ZLC4_PARTI